MRQKSGRAPKAAEQAAPKKRAEDVMLIHGVSEDGESMAVLRARNNRVEAGVVRSVKEGQPLEGELVRLKPRPELPLLCDVDVEVPAGAINAAGGTDASRTGPAQVATPAYRANYDAIWKKAKAGKKSLPN